MNHYAFYPGRSPILVDLDDFAHTTTEILHASLSLEDFQIYLNHCPDVPDRIDEIHYNSQGRLVKLVYRIRRQKATWVTEDYTGQHVRCWAARYTEQPKGNEPAVFQMIKSTESEAVLQISGSHNMKPSEFELVEVDQATFDLWMEQFRAVDDTELPF